MTPQIQKWKPRFYTANVEFRKPPIPNNVAQGAISQASVTIQNVPFVLRRVSACVATLSNIIWPGGVVPFFAEHASAFGFSFTMRTDSHVYLSDQAVALPAIGSVLDLTDLPSPVELQPKATVTFDATNLIERDATTVLQFVLAGVEPAEMFAERV